MNLTGWLLILSSLGFILWRSRRIPLSGWRRRLAVGCRLAAVGALLMALAGGARHRRTEAPRYLLYLVDGSSSIDARQREWLARRIASVDALRPQAMERAVVSFGADARLVVPFGRERLDDPALIRRALEGAGADPARTNVEAALLSVPAWLPPRHLSVQPSGAAEPRGSVVLLSDGRETDGSAAGIAAAVRRLGLAVFPVPPPLFGEARTVWEELAVPPVVQQGSPVPLQLVVANGSPRPKRAEVAVALHGVVIKRQRMTVRPGWQVLTLDIPAIGRGTMALDVSLAIPDERLAERRRAYTEVEGPPRVALVTDRAAALSPFASALKRREIELAVLRPADLADGALLDYDALVLFNLPKSSLADGQVEAIRTYVERFGGGLVMVGLGGDLAKEIQTPSPLDALLPVQFEPKGLREAKRRVCMILLIDRSASMLGPRIAATKRAAVALVKQLSPEDLVGILAFDTQPYVVAEVQQAEQVGPRLVEKLVKLRSSGGTDVFPALTASADRLELTGATLKHIILLSDGNTPFNRAAYTALVESFRHSGVTVSTIGIGAAFINEDYLRWLAESTGGTFYQMRSLEELPQLIARDTQEELGRLPFAEGLFRPSKTPTAEWFEGTDEWPRLRGYVTATAKPGSRVELTVDGGEGEEPLLVRWTVGQGRVVSFTSDADTRWSPEWIRWPGFEGAWGQVVRWAMRPRMTEELFVWVDESRAVPQLVVEGALQTPRGTLAAGEGGSSLPLSLVQTGAWRWQASLDQVPSGWYEVMLESSPADADHGPLLAKRWVQVGTPPAAQELPGQPPRESLLRQLARATGGAFDAPDRALLPPTATATVAEPLLSWWLPVVIVALLLDIAARGSSML
ncbi:MAG: VWA domain-containing protein [Candidatus Omnitrophica bacterium]|nr:VWA domain-containing protein [Candidatus Omnitrophota bacterium]